MKTKLFRTATVPLSLNTLLKGQLKFLNETFEVTAISGEGEDLDEIKKARRGKYLCYCNVAPYCSFERFEFSAETLPLVQKRKTYYSTFYYSPL